MNQSRRKLLLAAPALTGIGTGSAAAAGTSKSSKLKRVFYPDGKPDSKEIPLYSEVIAHGDLIFVSGQGVNTSAHIRAQTKAVLDRIEKCLTAARSSMEKALKCNVYLRHLEDYAAMNDVYRGRFGAEPPVRTTLAVTGIPLEGCLIEIELIAAGIESSCAGRSGRRC